MGLKVRACVWGVAVLIAASALTLDLTGVLRSGVTVPGMALAFVLSLAAGVWQFYEMHEQITGVKVAVTAIPPGRDWRRWQSDNDNHRLTEISAELHVVATNLGSEIKRISEVYVELYRPRRPWRPRRQMIAVAPSRDIDKKHYERGKRVEWIIKPESEVHHYVVFHNEWNRGDGPKLRDLLDLDVVLQFGTRNRRKRVRAERYSQQGSEEATVFLSHRIQLDDIIQRGDELVARILHDVGGAEAEEAWRIRAEQHLESGAPQRFVTDFKGAITPKDQAQFKGTLLSGDTTWARLRKLAREVEILREYRDAE